MGRSKKELKLGCELMELIKTFNLSGKAEKALELLLSDEESQAAQDYANTVSIVRLGYNDHGPVHMRTCAMNAMIMLRLLRQAEVKTSLEKDGCGDFEDSLIAILFACLLHDVGMGVGRQDHELHSAYLSLPIINRMIGELYQGNMQKQAMVRCLAIEGITGHMGTSSVHSLEAGVVQVADGCDMTKGRARIPIQLGLLSKTGHIHQFSANSIEEVRINAGQERPIRVDVYMSNDAGYFQVEEVLLKKIAGSTAKSYIELYAQVKDEAARQYL